MKRACLWMMVLSMLLVGVSMPALAEETMIDLNAPAEIAGVVLREDTVLITAEGTYRLTGETADLAVQLDTTGAVTLILDNVSINSADRPAIDIQNAEDAAIELAENSQNALTSGGDCKAVIYSKVKLTIGGNGALSVFTDDVKGIQSKKSISIESGVITIDSHEDAVHAGKGITVSGGEITIRTEGDGMSADDDLRVTGGTIDITTTGKPVAVSADADPEMAAQTAEAPIVLDGEQLIDFDHGVYQGATLSDGVLLIASGGDYRLTGSEEGISIRVETMGDVNLIFDGIAMSVSDTPLLYVETAGSITLTLAEGSQNDVSATGDVKAVLFAKTNLTIDGKGALNVTSDTAKGIKSKYTLMVNGGIITVDTKMDAISVDGDLEINGGTLDLTTRGVALAVAGETRQNGGNITVDQPENAEAALNVEEAEEPEETAASESSEGKYEYVKTWTVYDDGQVVDTGSGEVTAVVMDFEMACKGLKAEDKIEISGGVITLNTADHAIRSVGDLTIAGGEMTIASTYGKGISSHANLVIEGNETRILITQCTEGIEGKGTLTINDGVIVIHATDDALNAGDAESENPGVVLVINGGDIEVDSMDDCIDANGILELNGGLIKAGKSKGVVTGFNAAFSGTEVDIHPGVSLLVALGSSEEMSVDCVQYALLIYFTEIHAAGEAVTVTDGGSEAIISYKLPRACASLYLTSPDFNESAAVSVQAGEETVTTELAELLTIIGTTGDVTSGAQDGNGDGGFQWQSHYNGN